MEAILKFNLDDIDDATAHKRCIHSLDMACSILDIQYNIRKSANNKIDFMIEKGNKPDVFEVVDLVMDMVNEIIEDNSVVIDDLIL